MPAVEDKNVVIIERKFGVMSEAEQYRLEIEPLKEWGFRIEEIRKHYIGDSNYAVLGWRIVEI